MLPQITETCIHSFTSKHNWPSQNLFVDKSTTKIQNGHTKGSCLKGGKFAPQTKRNHSCNRFIVEGPFLPCAILVKIYSFDDDEYYWHMKCLFHPFAKFAVANISCLSITAQECLGLSQWFQINADGCKMQEGSLTIKWLWLKKSCKYIMYIYSLQSPIHFLVAFTKTFWKHKYLLFHFR